MGEHQGECVTQLAARRPDFDGGSGAKDKQTSEERIVSWRRIFIGKYWKYFQS